LGENELFYGGYLEILRSAVDSFVKRLALLEKEYSEENRRFPVEHYKIRIKSADSAKAKLERLGLPVTAESAMNNLFDLAGVRLVCRFFNEVYEITRILVEVVIWEQSHTTEKTNKINYLSANDKQYLCAKSYTKAQTRQWRLQNSQKRYKERRADKDNPRGVLYIKMSAKRGMRLCRFAHLKALHLQ
jgi:hypothetical protein